MKELLLAKERPYLGVVNGHFALEVMIVTRVWSFGPCALRKETNSVLEALATANNVHKGEDKAHKVGCHERALIDRRAVTWMPLHSSEMSGPNLCSRSMLSVGRI